MRGEPNDGWYNQPGEGRLKPFTPPTTYLHQSHKSLFLAGSHIRSGVTFFSPGFASLAHLHPTTRETQPVFLELWHQTHLDHLHQLVQLDLLLGPPRPPSSTCSARPAPPPSTSCTCNSSQLDFVRPNYLLHPFTESKQTINNNFSHYHRNNHLLVRVEVRRAITRKE